VLNATDIHKEMFPVYGGKYLLSCKVFHSWVKIFSEERWKIEVDARPVAEITETSIKSLLLRCGFQRTDDDMVEK
jgi:hypothetical protein